MSKYIKVYETMCKNDPISSDDPRRKAIIAEMRFIHRAKTAEDAARYIKWWDCWPNPSEKSALEFVKKARKLLRR